MYPTTWDLSRYFYTGLDDPRLATDIDNILPSTRAFATIYADTFSTYTTPQQILQFYTDYTQFSHDIATPSYYLFYRSSLDTQDLDVTKRMWEIEYISTQASNMLLWIAQGWKDIGYTQILQWANDPLLVPYRNDLVSTAESIQYILGVDTERALNHKSRSMSLPNTLHDELTGAYTYTMDIYGEIKTLTEEEVRSYRQHTDRNIRREAYAALRRVYNTKTNQIALGNIYTAIVKDYTSEIDMRDMPKNVMSQRNMSEEMEDSVVDMLLSQVQTAYPLYQRFLRAKAKMLNLGNKNQEGDNKEVHTDTFAVYDIGAPLGHADRDYTFDQAYDLHLSVMKEFDPEFYTYSLDMIQQGRIDVYPRAGKRGGAFASYRKNEESMVLLNFTGKLRDVSTISHELWHAIHGHLSQVQEAPVYDSPLSMAETASIFAEMLLGEKIKSMVSTDEYREYLNERLGDIFATIWRQVQYVAFERDVHTQIYSGQELSYRDLNILWRKHQTALYGDSVSYDVPAEDESGWSMIPHIYHSPFYCYAYAFGNILTFAIYDHVHTGRLSREDYKDILRAGGSVRPRELLLRYGIDISTPEFYMAGISQVERMVEEFEKLAV